MSYVIKPIDNKETYDAFLKTPSLKPHLTFMHTWEWGEVLSEESLDFMRVGVYDSATLIGVAQLAKYRLRLGGEYWYSPRGIAMDYSSPEIVASAYKALNDYVKKLGGAFFKVDPDIVRGESAEGAIDTLQPRHAAMFTQAERVWCVDLQKDEESLLAWMKDHGMRKNIPYYLRKARREGAIVKASDKPEDLGVLIRLLDALRVRKNMVGGSEKHLVRQFTKLAPKGYEKLFIAEKDGQFVASALISIYGREASYLHGASNELFRDLQIPHLMHVEMMNYLMEHHPEVERYNFWGVVSDKNRTPKHPRHGYSEFKRSFGGYKEEYMRARDFVYNPVQWRLDWLLQKYWAWKYKND